MVALYPLYDRKVSLSYRLCSRPVGGSVVPHFSLGTLLVSRRGLLPRSAERSSTERKLGYLSHLFSCLKQESYLFTGPHTEACNRFMEAHLGLAMSVRWKKNVEPLIPEPVGWLMTSLKQVAVRIQSIQLCPEWDISRANSTWWLFTMADERKKLVWAVKKGLFCLFADDQLASNIPGTPDQNQLSWKKMMKRAVCVFIHE